MNAKKFLLPSLLAGAALALTLRRAIQPAPAKPVAGRGGCAAIDAYLEQQMRRLNLPGASLAIVEGDQITHVRGFGRARPGGEAPTPQTPFAIGSTTKSFTALAVMQLVEAGKVELDAPLQRYLPWFQVIAPKKCAVDPRAATRITVRHLLNQTSGLPLLAGWENLSDFDDRPGAALSGLRLSHPAGETFEYSNINYDLLGQVIEAASGEPYAAYVQKHIFDPLVMRHSHTSQAAAKRDGVATGHLSWFGVPVAVPDLPMAEASLPSGQLLSSAEDMARYLIAHLNGGRCGDAQLLSPAGIAELHRPAIQALTLNDPPGWYAMGWYVEQLDGVKVLSHTGLVPDFFAFMALLPEQKKGLVVLFNVDHATMQMTLSEVGFGLARLLAGLSPAPLRFGAIPWVQRALLLVPLLQLIDVIVTLGRLRRWRQDPARRPRGGRLWGRQILLPMLPNLLPALALLPLLTRMRGFLLLFMPDASWLALTSGSFAALWTILRPALLLRRPHPSRSNS